MNILITGGNGYKGTVLIPKLLKLGHNVRSVDNNWFGSYLKPHKNPRSVITASNVQIRSPINAKSVGGWRNYQTLLEPAIEILIKTEKYQNLIN